MTSLKRYFLLTIGVFLVSLQSYSQDTVEYKPLTRTGIDWKYCTSYLKDGRDIIISPFKWNGREWLGFAGVAAATGGLMFIDDDIQRIVQNNRNPATNSISQYGLEPWGNWYTGGAVASVYFHGLIWNNDKSKRVGMLSAKAFLLSAAFVSIPKYAFQRHRPGTFNQNQFIFEGPLGNYKNDSFVSGHTTAVFAVAAVMASEYKETKWVPPLAYTIAALTGVSRIHDNRHWASDVLAGAALGYAIGKLVYNQDNWGIRVVPMGNGLGMVIPLDGNKVN